MTTFDQALANLQANSNQMAALAKGYNVDVAKFETKKAQDLSRLFLFAGEVGKDISNRLAERKAREEAVRKAKEEAQRKAKEEAEQEAKFKE